MPIVTDSSSDKRMQEQENSQEGKSEIRFEDVENARQMYLAKSQAVTKKRKKAILISIAVVLAIDVMVLLVNNKTVFKPPVISSSVTMLATLTPLFVILVMEIVFITLGVYLLTGGNATIEEYSTYKRMYKGYFISRQLDSVFTNLQYSHQLGLDKDILQNTQLIDTGDRYHSNDLVKAEYKSTGFMQADVHIEERREEKDNEGHVRVYYDTIFKGRFLVFEFPKKFDFKMVISFSGYDQSYINPKTKRGLNRIETESLEFNKRFLVYAEDGFEAFYILNPVFMENLEKLGQKYNNNLALYFSDKQLFVGLNDGGDAFEPPDPSVPIDEEQEKAKVVNDMKLITELVDNLKLSHP